MLDESARPDKHWKILLLIMAASVTTCYGRKKGRTGYLLMMRAFQHPAFTAGRQVCFC